MDYKIAVEEAQKMVDRYKPYCDDVNVEYIGHFKTANTQSCATIEIENRIAELEQIRSMVGRELGSLVNIELTVRIRNLKLIKDQISDTK